MKVTSDINIRVVFWADWNEHSYMHKHAKLDANGAFTYAHSQQGCTSTQSLLDQRDVHENQVIRSVGHRKVLICPLCRKPQSNKSEDLICVQPPSLQIQDHNEELCLRDALQKTKLCLPSISDSSAATDFRSAVIQTATQDWVLIPSGKKKAQRCFHQVQFQR